MNQSKLEANTCSWHEARENLRERVTIGFGFSSDWLRKWREIFKPITKRSNAKPKQTQFIFDTQVKTALRNMSQISATSHITSLLPGPGYSNKVYCSLGHGRCRSRYRIDWYLVGCMRSNISTLGNVIKTS